MSETGQHTTTASTHFPETRPEQVFECLAYRGDANSIEEMDAGIMEEARKRHVHD